MKKKFIFFFVFSISFFTLVLFTARIIFLYKIADQNYSMKNPSPSQITSSHNRIEQNNSSNADIINTAHSISCFNSSGNVIITIPEFVMNMQCTQYTLQHGETLTSIAQKYISTCTINSAVKLIKEASKITNADSISAGSKIYIPETILKNGYLHTITSGDTWSKLCRDYYPIYNSDYMTKLLIFINDMPDSNLPLNTEIYLPNINI